MIRMFTIVYNQVLEILMHHNSRGYKDFLY
jgi:hypothetical protein